MKNTIMISACCIAACCMAGLSANFTPILSGTGKLIFPEASPAANMGASSGALTVAAGGTNKNIILQPTGSGCVQLFADSPAITLCDSSGQITVAAGGTNQNVVLNPTGTGAASVLAASSDPSGVKGNLILNTAGTASGLHMGVLDSNYMWIQSYASLPLVLNKVGNAVGIGKVPTSTYSLDGSSDVNTDGIFRKGGTAGVGSGSSITVCTSAACASSCTLIFNGGIRTGGTCP